MAGKGSQTELLFKALADRTRLARICCAPQMPVRLQGAPRPASLG